MQCLGSFFARKVDTYSKDIGKSNLENTKYRKYIETGPVEKGELQLRQFPGSLVHFLRQHFCDVSSFLSMSVTAAVPLLAP